MTASRITIITFAWPPRNTIGAHRPYSWAKYWSANGAKVRVLTAKKYEYDDPLDLNLPEIPGVEVIEIDYRKQKTSAHRTVAGSRLKKPALWLFRKFRDLGFPVRNPRDAWVNAAISISEDLAKDCDFLISTYDPKAVHQIAAAMKRSNPKLFWLADYRDLWSLNHLATGSKAQRKRDFEIEMSTVGSLADMVSSISEDLAKKQGDLVKKPWISIANGFDIDTKSLQKATTRSLPPPSLPLKITYTGKIYAGTRDPMPLLEAILELEKSNKISKGMVEVNVFGGQIEGIAPMMKTGIFDHFVKLHGHVSRDVALEAQAKADLLLMLESPSIEARGVLTGKVFEYMATGVPILSLGSRKDSAIAELLDATGTGLCTEDDRELISAAILTRLSGLTLDWYRPNFASILQYSRENQAELMLKEISKRAADKSLKEPFLG